MSLMSSCGAHLSNIVLGNLYEAERSSGSNPFTKMAGKQVSGGLAVASDMSGAQFSNPPDKVLCVAVWMITGFVQW
jgi:hypothetical protein